MSLAEESPLLSFSYFEQLRQAQAIVQAEADVLSNLAANLDADFCDAAHALYECAGHVVVVGMGKAGLIGQKIVATFSSTGTPAIFLHPSEAVHGDLGVVRDSDVVVALSNSGETSEVCDLLPHFQKMRLPVIAITATRTSTLGSKSTITVPLGRLREAGMHGLAPSCSTTAMLALGDALALVLSQMRSFSARDFARFHPGGSLGDRLKKVSEVMRKGFQLRVSSESQTIREVFVAQPYPGRRTGAVMLVSDKGKLTGLFTDSDLARLLEAHQERQLDRPISEVMTRDPFTVRDSLLLSEVVDLLSDKKISEVPVVDAAGRPVGLIDITDIIGLMPTEA